MQKVRILLILGVFITILPYLGFPYSWKDVLYTLSGLVFIFLSYLLYKDYKVKENQENTFDNFSENNNFDEIIVETTQQEEESAKLN